MTQPTEHADDDGVDALVAAWKTRLQDTPPAATALLAALADTSSDDLAGHFYAILLEDERAAAFLSLSQVREQLMPAMRRWVCSLLGADAQAIEHLLAVNHHVGKVHARIGIPVDLVARGMRVLRERLQWHVACAAPPPQVALAAIAGIDCALDIAMESMTRAYLKAHDRVARTDAAYRLFSLFQNIGTERERQRALLLAWENGLLYALASQGPGVRSGPLLSDSEFGLWFTHKGLPSFGEGGETRRICALIAEVDALLQETGADALLAIRERTEAIRQLLNMLFERIGELETGSDPLTHLLNRRFLPSVLRREIELARDGRARFAVVLLDLDRFKAINDAHGHDTGDRVLQHVALTLTQSVRGSDYLFRLGGEEFMVVLIGVDAAQALAIAEQIRLRLAENPVALSEGRTLAITASIGVAPHDGHPDYQHLMTRADRAMYQAKQRGRDRVMLADAAAAQPQAEPVA